MKKRNKILGLMVGAVALVGVSVMGTMAYLTSQDTVTNTFTVGNVSITLDEQDVDGSTSGAERDKANAYKLMPGHEYTKDPIIHVASGSEDCYLFVKITNEIANIEGGTTVAQQMSAHGWVSVSGTTGVYVYTTDKTNPAIVTAGANINVFDVFTINDTVDNTTLASYAGKQIIVNAYAVQADGFAGKTAEEIWAAASFN